MEDKRIIQYIRGDEIPEKELIQVLDWVEASDENQQHYNELKKLWVITGLKGAKSQNSKKFFTSSSFGKSIQLNFSQQWLKYAAVFLLAFITGASSLFLFNKNTSRQFVDAYNEVHVPNGEKSMVTLYDGTEVWLNSGTTLKYPVVFKDGVRDVYLDGEAFFDVAKDKKNPFYVNAGEMKVKVLGTRFNVYAYQDENLLHTTLEEGIVDVSIVGSSKMVHLTPGEQMAYSPDTREYEKIDVDTELFTSWKENMLRFDNAELGEILKKMERWYDVKMNIDAKLDLSDKYTITIKTESIREMLDGLSLTTEMKYKIKDDLVEISRK